MLKSEYVKFSFENTNNKEINKLISEYKKDISGSKKTLKDWLLEVYIYTLIDGLFKGEYFNEIINLFENNMLLNEYFLFEIAYSYGVAGNNNKSEKYYLEYIEHNGKSCAVYNNLGIIYENRGDLIKALKNYQESILLDKDNEKAKNNLERINQKIKEQQDALEKFKNENSFIHNKLQYFLKNKNTNGEIVCPYKLLPKFIGLNQNKTHEVFNNWLSSSYVIKRDHKDEQTGANVYIVNSFIESYLEKYQIESIIDNDLLTKTQKLDINYFNKLGYNKELENNLLNKIHIKDIKDILKRDLYELVILISLGLNKSSLILGGSLIEAILIDLLLKKGIVNINIRGKNKKTETLDLNDLLEEAYSKNFISNNLYHLAHGVRGFRNLVHPGAEYRKEELEVSDDNVNIVWTILKKLINELK